MKSDQVDQLVVRSSSKWSDHDVCLLKLLSFLGLDRQLIAHLLGLQIKQVLSKLQNEQRGLKKVQN